MNDFKFWFAIGFISIIFVIGLIIRHVHVVRYDRKMSEARKELNNSYSLQNKLDDICMKHHEQMPYDPW